MYILLMNDTGLINLLCLNIGVISKISQIEEDNYCMISFIVNDIIESKKVKPGLNRIKWWLTEEGVGQG